MKIALCFIINYNNEIKKETLWKDWIKPNDDIIDVFIHFNKHIPIQSEWIRKHAIPDKYVVDTSYYHVVPAYLSLLHFSYRSSNNMQWFCMLTESCVPIISPAQFRCIFMSNYSKSIFSWRKAWWNVNFHKRANLRYFEESMRLGNDPWFVMKREDVLRIISYPVKNTHTFNIICEGGLANESVFSMILYQNKSLEQVINVSSHITDWSKPSSATSPYVFSFANNDELQYIHDTIHKNEYAMFLRKIDDSFPDGSIKNIWYNNTNSVCDNTEKTSISQDLLRYIYSCLLLCSLIIFSIVFCV